MLFKLFFHLTLASASSFQTDLARCEREVKAAPGDYEVAKCFQRVLGSALEQGREENLHQQVQTYLAELQRREPSIRYLDIVGGNLDWSIDATRALSRYRAAAKQYERLGDDVGRAISHANATQLLFWELHRLEESSAESRVLWDIAETSDDRQARRLAAILGASYACDVGLEVGRALERLNKITQDELDESMYSVQREVLLSRSTCAIFQLDFRQAEQDLRQLRAVAQREKDLKTVATVGYRLSYLLTHQLEYNFEMNQQLVAAAEKRLNQALALARDAKDIDRQVRSLADLSVLLGGQNDRLNEAIETAKTCERVAAHRPDPALFTMCAVAESQVLREHDPQRAKAQALRALKDVPKVADSRVRLSALRAALRRSYSGEPDEKFLAVAKRLILAIEAQREAQRGAIARRNIFAAWTQDYYWLSYRLLKDGLDNPESLSRAFDVLERSRARGLHESLLRTVSDPNGIENASQRSKVAREVILQQQAGEKGHLESSGWEDSTLPKMHRIQAQLLKHEAMVIYQTADESTYDGEELGGAWALVLTPERAFAVDLSTSYSVLQNAAGILRAHIMSDSVQLDAGRKKVRAMILDPILERLGTHVTSLVVVPDGPLHEMSFSALAPDYLLSWTPSASIWSRLRAERKLGQAVSGISLVDPLRKLTGENKGGAVRSLDDEDGEPNRPLPESRREAVAAQRYLSSSLRVFEGQQAKLSSLIRSWRADDNFLHIAAHSQINSEDPQDSSILLSNTTGRGEGRLSISAINRLPLDRTVVVLAGCATGFGSWLAGEGALSLARAFQRAGASAVVASLWPIRDDHAASFFERFYQALGTGASVSKSLAQARASMIEAGYPASSYESFVALGDGGVYFERAQEGTERHRVFGMSRYVIWFILGLIALAIGVYLPKLSRMWSNR